MTDSKGRPPDFGDPRGRAEEGFLNTEAASPELSPAEAARLIHGLRAYQKELERQNEELRLSLARLAESCNKYADLYDVAPVAYLTLDGQGRIVEANLTAVALLGIERPQLLGHFFPMFLSDPDRQAFRRLLDNGLNQREQQGEFRLQDCDGKVRSVLLDVLFLQEAGGRGQFRLAITDITELKRTQEELRLQKESLENLAAERTAELLAVNEQLLEAQENLRVLFQAAPLAMGIFDAEGRILAVNEASQSIFGWTQEEVVGHLPPSIPPETREESLAIMRRVLQGESLLGVEIKQQRKDGSLFDMRFSAGPLYNKEGQVRGFVGLAEDVTARKRAEEALRRAKEDWESTFDSVADCIAILDKDHRITRMNRAMAELLGRPVEEVLGQPCYKAVHGLDAAPAYCPHARVVATGRAQFEEVQEFGRIFAVSVTPLSGAEGELIGSVHVARDITEQKTAEQTLRLSNQRLDLLAETASRLLATDSPETVVDSLCQKVMEFLDCQVFFNYLCYEDEERLHLNAYAGIPEEEARRIEWLDYGASVCGCAARDGCRIVAEDIQTAADPQTELVKAYGVQACACHPLLVQGRVLGTLSFGTRTRPRFTPDELSLMNAVADHVAIAMHRKLTQQALRESRDDLNRAQAVAHIGSWRLDVRRNKLTWSEENHRIFGIPPGAAMTYETFLATVHPEDRKYVDREWKAALQGKPYDIEHRIIVDGKVKWVRERAELEFDHEGRLLGGFGTTQDITGRKEMEEALKQAHARTVAILNSISDGFFALDRDLVVTYYNRAAEKVLGRKAEEVLGKRLFDAFPEARGSIFEKKYTEALHTGKALAFEAYFDVPPFENWYDVRVYPFGDGLSVYFQVTTERKQAEEELRRARDELELRVQERTAELKQAYEQLLREMEEHQETAARLRESEARFAAFMENLPGAAVMRDLDGRYLFMNTGWEKMFGKDRAACLNKTLEEVWPAAQASLMRTNDREALLQGQQVEHVLTLNRNGTEVHLLCLHFPVRDEGGHPFMVGSIYLDITRRVKAEEALATERQRLDAVLDNIPAYVALLAPDFTLPVVNREFVQRFGEPGNRPCYEFLFGREEPCPNCKALQVFETDTPEIWEWAGPDGNTYQIYDYPFIDVDGSPLVLEMGVEITDRKRAELEARRQTAIVDGMNRIFRDTLTCETQSDLGRTCLTVAQELTGSRFGFISLLNGEGSLDFLASSAPDRRARGKAGYKGLPSQVPVKGLYQSVIERGMSLLINDPASQPDWPGLPHGFPPPGAFLAVPLKRGQKVIGMLGLGDREGGYTPTELETAESLAVAVAEALLHKQAEAALKQSEENLHVLAARLMDVQESERRRFSRELHDELGQSLLLLKLLLSSIQAGISGVREEVQRECREALLHLDKLVDEVRRLSRDLSPSPLEELGLTSALKHVFQEFCKHYKLSQSSIKIENIDECYGSAARLNIYRIFQEALTNIGKHAEASKISVHVKRQVRRATFSIMDNGKGFQVSEVLARQAGEPGIGLASIYERLRAMGGDMKIISRKGRGTRLVFSVPFSRGE